MSSSGSTKTILKYHSVMLWKIRGIFLESNLPSNPNTVPSNSSPITPNHIQKLSSNSSWKTGLAFMDWKSLLFHLGAKFTFLHMKWLLLKFLRKIKIFSTSINYRQPTIEFFLIKLSILKFAVTKSPKIRMSHGCMILISWLIQQANISFMLFFNKHYSTQSLSKSQSQSKKANNHRKTWPRKRPKSNKEEERSKCRKRGFYKKKWEKSKKKNKKLNKLKGELKMLSKNTLRINSKWKIDKWKKERPERNFKLEEDSTSLN